MQHLFPELLSIAHRAGEAIMEIYASSIMVEHKRDSSPVTAADMAAHAIIVPALQQLTPTIPIISEEDSHNWAQRLSYPRYWLIDPLDGTKEFIKRNDEFTVNIALIDQHQPVLGVITAPALDQAFWGIVDDPETSAWQQNGLHPAATIHTRLLNTEQPTCLVSRSHADQRLQTWLDGLTNQQCHPTTTAMGSSLKLCRIATGDADIYARFGPTSEWDIAAGHAILMAAGGEIRTHRAKRLQYGVLQSHHHNAADTLNPDFIASGQSLPSAWSRTFQNIDPT